MGSSWRCLHKEGKCTVDPVAIATLQSTWRWWWGGGVGGGGLLAVGVVCVVWHNCMISSGAQSFSSQVLPARHGFVELRCVGLAWFLVQL
jgi:hypothetical protein